MRFKMALNFEILSSSSSSSSSSLFVNVVNTFFGSFLQQADRAARQKHLHGLDLFLESARAQLKALMDDQTELDPSETSGL